MSEFDGVLSLGATVGVKDEADHPWMSVERQVLEKRSPGARRRSGSARGPAPGERAGAPVGRSGSAKTGWAQVKIDAQAAEDPVLAALGPRPHVFQFHYDTFGTQNGEILGRCGSLMQAARSGGAWAVQFHIEVSLGTIHSWIGTYADEMRGQGVALDALAAETAERWNSYLRVAHAFGDAFRERSSRSPHNANPSSPPSCTAGGVRSGGRR